MEPGWDLDGIGRNYTYSTPSQLSVDCRSVHYTPNLARTILALKLASMTTTSG